MLAALLTSVGLHSTFDGYLRERATEAGEHSRAAAEQSFADAGARWTPATLDLLAHDFAGTGYDFRLTSTDGRVLLDTTKTASGRRPDLLHASEVRGPSGKPVAVIEVFALSPEVRTPADARFTRELDRWHLVAALIAGLIAILVGIVTAARLARPLGTLSETAGSLARGGRSQAGRVTGPPEIRRVGDALTSLSEDIERQRRGRLQLAQDLAHELRTPIMVVQSRLEAMQDGVIPVDADGIEALHATTVRLGRLIGEIERLAESEASPRVVAREALQVDAIAEQVLSALSGAMGARRIRTRSSLGSVLAWGDEDAVGQILTILLTNAAKYAPAGSEVLVSTSGGGGWAEVAVSDRGGSLTGEHGTRIFQRFYRGHEARVREEGLGLGLAIARDLAEAMSGSLELEATETSTRFVLRLPAAPAHLAPGRSAPLAS